MNPWLGSGLPDLLASFEDIKWCMDVLRMLQTSHRHRLCASQGSAGFGRLWAMNHTEWPHGLMGCVGSFGLGFMMPGMAYCMSSIIAVFYDPDPAQIPLQARTTTHPGVLHVLHDRSVLQPGPRPDPPSRRAFRVPGKPATPL